MMIPLQLLAHHVSVALGRDVDKRRHLATSVTGK
jgi:glucosamine 6-phosphate synthetase-like amidotransferase/phosphosugar isomerase protein